MHETSLLKLILIRLHVTDMYTRLTGKYNNVGENSVDMDDDQWDLGHHPCQQSSHQSYFPGQGVYRKFSSG